MMRYRVRCGRLVGYRTANDPKIAALLLVEKWRQYIRENIIVVAIPCSNEPPRFLWVPTLLEELDAQSNSRFRLCDNSEVVDFVESNLQTQEQASQLVLRFSTIEQGSCFAQSNDRQAKS